MIPPLLFHTLSHCLVILTSLIMAYDKQPNKQTNNTLNIKPIQIYQTMHYRNIPIISGNQEFSRQISKPATFSFSCSDVWYISQLKITKIINSEYLLHFWLTCYSLLNKVVFTKKLWFGNLLLVLENVHLEQIVGSGFYSFFCILNQNQFFHFFFTHNYVSVLHLHTKY